MSIAKAYKYLFFRIYHWHLVRYGERNDPKLVGIIITSLLLLMNLLTLAIFYQIGVGYRLQISKAYLVIGYFVMLFVSYIVLYRDFASISSEFSTEEETSEKRRTRWCWAYIVSTQVLFFGSAFLLP